MSEVDVVGREIIQHHSKSFSMASRLLPPETRSHVVALYAWCRRADDAIDLTEPARQRDSLETLESELRDVYSGSDVRDPVLRIFQRAVRERDVPIEYPLDLLKGMEMDVLGRRYETTGQLLEYCYHVAGCVGLMMCHVMGIRDEAALPNAAHLGIAMQLTNVCRDVEEDWGRGRLYLPDSLLAEHGAPSLADQLGAPFPEAARAPSAGAIASILREADRYYASGDEGLQALEWRCALSIRTARVVYASIGDRIRDQDCDPLAGRAFVSGRAKVLLAVGTLFASLGDLPSRWIGGRGLGVRKPSTVLRFPVDILPVGQRGSPGSGSLT